MSMMELLSQMRESEPEPRSSAKEACRGFVSFFRTNA